MVHTEGPALDGPKLAYRTNGLTPLGSPDSPDGDLALMNCKNRVEVAAIRAETHADRCA